MGWQMALIKAKLVSSECMGIEEELTVPHGSWYLFSEQIDSVWQKPSLSSRWAGLLWQAFSSVFPNGLSMLMWTRVSKKSIKAGIFKNPVLICGYLAIICVLCMSCVYVNPMDMTVQEREYMALPFYLPDLHLGKTDFDLARVVGG